MVKCCVDNCSKYYKGIELNLKYHRFPGKNKKLAEMWCKAVGKPNLKVRKARICSQHFSLDCYTEDMVLKKGAVPFLNLNEENGSKKIPFRTDNTSKKGNSEDEVAEMLLDHDYLNCSSDNPNNGVVNKEDEIPTQLVIILPQSNESNNLNIINSTPSDSNRTLVKYDENTSISYPHTSHPVIFNSKAVQKIWTPEDFGFVNPLNKKSDDILHDRDNYTELKKIPINDVPENIKNAVESMKKKSQTFVPNDVLEELTNHPSNSDSSMKHVYSGSSIVSDLPSYCSSKSTNQPFNKCVGVKSNNLKPDLFKKFSSTKKLNEIPPNNEKNVEKLKFKIKELLKEKLSLKMKLLELDQLITSLIQKQKIDLDVAEILFNHLWSNKEESYSDDILLKDFS